MSAATEMPTPKPTPRPIVEVLGPLPVLPLPPPVLVGFELAVCDVVESDEVAVADVDN